MESVPPMTPEAAQASLQELTSARERIANRITSPWWYRVGAALCMASGLVGMSLLTGNSGPGGPGYPGGFELMLVCCIGFPVLMWALHRSTGVSIDRYDEGVARYELVMFALIAVGFLLQGWLRVPFALAAVGIVASVVQYDIERRIDTSLRERVRVGG
jgi:hypothetical protein